MKSWFTIKAQGNDEAEVLIYGEIGYFGILATDLIKEIKALGSPKNLTVRVNSQGGAWVQGLAIYNYLARYSGNVTFIIDGIAASIASMIVMAGKVVMPENTFLMIHDIIGYADGTPDEIREQADIFDKLKLSIVQAYVAKSKQTEKKILEMMADEVWLTAQEAKDLGFADEISSPVKLAARAELADVFKNVPKALTEKIEPAPNPNPAPAPANIAPDPDKIRAEATTAAAEAAKKTAGEIVVLCAAAKFPDLAGEFIAKGMTVEQVKTRMADVDTIRALCLAAKLPDRAANYVRAGNTKEEVQKELFALVTKRDTTEIDNKLDQDRQRKSVPVIDTKAIYDSRRERTHRA